MKCSIIFANPWILCVHCAKNPFFSDFIKHFDLFEGNTTWNGLVGNEKSDIYSLSAIIDHVHVMANTTHKKCANCRDQEIICFNIDEMPKICAQAWVFADWAISIHNWYVAKLKIASFLGDCGCCCYRCRSQHEYSST